MALATRGTNFCREEVVRHEWELAKELGLNITVHVAMYRFGYTKMQLSELKEMDLLYPNTTYIHSSHLTEDEWAHGPRLGQQRLVRAADRAADGSRLGAGGQGARLRRADRPVVRRGDDGVVGPVHPDARDLRLGAGAPHQVAWDENLEWDAPESKLITARQVLAMATIGGAEVAGIADRTGSLTPGKQADIVIIDGSAVNVAPVIDPVGAVVCAADISNVKTVLVAGEILKEDFRLKAVARRAAQGGRGVARLPRREVRRPGAGLGRQGHGIASPHDGGAGGPQRPRPPSSRHDRRCPRVTAKHPPRAASGACRGTASRASVSSILVRERSARPVTWADATEGAERMGDPERLPHGVHRQRDHGSLTYAGDDPAGPWPRSSPCASRRALRTQRRSTCSRARAPRHRRTSPIGAAS